MQRMIKKRAIHTIIAVLAVVGWMMSVVSSLYAAEDAASTGQQMNVSSCINAYVQYNIPFERNKACYQDNKLLPYLKESADEERQIGIMAKEAVALDKSTVDDPIPPDRVLSSSTANQTQDTSPIGSSDPSLTENSNKSLTELNENKESLSKSGIVPLENKTPERKTRKRFFFLI